MATLYEAMKTWKGTESRVELGWQTSQKSVILMLESERSAVDSWSQQKHNGLGQGRRQVLEMIENENRED